MEKTKIAGAAWRDKINDDMKVIEGGLAAPGGGRR
jgi:hypothetical protein